VALSSSILALLRAPWAMPTQTQVLLHATRQVLGLSQPDLAKITGASRRTAQRWYAGESALGDAHYARLAAAVHPVDAALAGRLAEAGHTTTDALALASAADAFRYEAAHLVDSVVCAAARAMALPPDVVRPGLLAAVERAREMRLSVDALASALAPVAVPPPAPKRRA
jgi:transcriptional regulator with XRE-family HTH domain